MHEPQSRKKIHLLVCRVLLFRDSLSVHVVYPFLLLLGGSVRNPSASRFDIIKKIVQYMPCPSPCVCRRFKSNYFAWHGNFP
jgi:hypothetical protein